jgi:hypothetical protein
MPIHHAIWKPSRSLKCSLASERLLEEMIVAGNRPRPLALQPPCVPAHSTSARTVYYSVTRAVSKRSTSYPVKRLTLFFLRL